MTALVAIAVVLLGAWGLGTLTGQRFVSALPTTVLAITFVLYLAYIVGLLHLAWWLVVAACLVGGLLALIRQVRRPGLAWSWSRLLPSPAVVAFLVALVVVLWFTHARYVSLWDELRLWAAYPKLLHVDGGLQVGPDSLLIGEMQTYTPGMPLFSYFVAAFSPVFAENRLFIAYGLFCVSLLAPIATRLTWRAPWWIVPAGVGMALAPLAYANGTVEMGDFYASLYVDPVLGILLGHILWLIGSNAVGERAGRLQFGLALAVLFLVKSSSLGLAVVMLLVVLVRWVHSTRGEAWRPRIRGALLLAGPFAIVVATWQPLLARLGPGSKFSSGYDMSPDLLLLELFVNALRRFPVLQPTVGLLPQYSSVLIMNTVLVVGIACVALAQHRDRARPMWVALVTLLVVQTAYLIGLFFLVAGPFEREFPSFARYTCMPLTAAWIFFALSLAGLGLPRPRRLRFVPVTALSACVVFLAVQFPMRGPSTYDGGWRAQASLDAEKITAAVDEYDEPGERVRAMIVYKDDFLAHVGPHHRTYFELLDDNVELDVYYPALITPDGEPAPDAQVEVARDTFVDYLVSTDVEYLIVGQPSDELAQQYADLFDRPPTIDALYRVESTGDGVRFRWIS